MDEWEIQTEMLNKGIWTFPQIEEWNSIKGCSIILYSIIIVESSFDLFSWCFIDVLHLPISYNLSWILPLYDTMSFVISHSKGCSILLSAHTILLISWCSIWRCCSVCSWWRISTKSFMIFWECFGEKKKIHKVT